MHVRVSYTVDVDDGFREEVRRYYGREGLATRQELKDWFYLHGQTMNDDLGAAGDEREEAEERYRYALEDVDVAGEASS